MATARRITLRRLRQTGGREVSETMKKIQAYIVYGGRRQFWSASLVLENGYAAFGHICSDPGYMPGDLLLNRPERQAVFKAMGYEVEIVGEPIAGSDNSPPWLLERHADKSHWEEFAAEYKRVEAELAMQSHQENITP